eukprot:TRINITY_DN928_c0_g1_i1.p1 TRINITY_DN928_c0_g1~~TRINITY_DN928_c0_g1_i1.p1  ORF type:complete len:355 (+),score=48.09 TRINITY_DN928_c0_g1_i1:118-1182(+)
MSKRKEANQKLINETKDVQAQTKDALSRIKNTTSETEDIGNQTLEELRAQGEQIGTITTDIEGVGDKLDEAQRLQNTFDKWGGGIFGFGKKKATKAAAAEIALRQQEELMNVKEVFEQQKYESLKSNWKAYNMVLCSNPTVEAPELFVPSVQASIPNSSWKIDYSLTGIDGDGWTYAYDFKELNKTGVGESAPKWNSYVRRRKWKYTDAPMGSSAKVAEIQQRHVSRVGKDKANNGSTQGEKIGYVSRQNVSNMKASGLVSAGMTGRRGKKDEELDEESAQGLKEIQQEDDEINQGIDDISDSLDRLHGISHQMKEETIAQNKKLDKMDAAMQNTGEKQAIVNQRLKRQIKSNS